MEEDREEVPEAPKPPTKEELSEVQKKLRRRNELLNEFGHLYIELQSLKEKVGASIDNPSQNIKRIMEAMDQFYGYYDHYNKLLDELREDGFIDENFEEQYREFQLKADADYQFTKVPKIDELRWKENEVFYQISPEDKAHCIRYAVVGPDGKNILGSISWAELYALESKLNPMDSIVAWGEEGYGEEKTKSTEFKEGLYRKSDYDPMQNFSPEHLLRITSQRGHTPTRLEDVPYFPKLYKKIKKLDSRCLPAIEKVVNDLKKTEQLVAEKESSYDVAIAFQIVFGILGGITWITAAITYFIHRSERADLKQQIEDLKNKQSELEAEYRQGKKLLASSESAKHPFEQEVHYHEQAINTLFKTFKERYEAYSESESESESDSEEDQSNESGRGRSRSSSRLDNESGNDETSEKSPRSNSPSPSTKR